MESSLGRKVRTVDGIEKLAMKSLRSKNISIYMYMHVINDALYSKYNVHVPYMNMITCTCIYMYMYVHNLYVHTYTLDYEPSDSMGICTCSYTYMYVVQGRMDMRQLHVVIH